MINSKLRSLYKSRFSEGEPCFLKELRERRRSSNEKERPAYPLLIGIDENRYMTSNIKIMIFGQETNSWERGTVEEFTPIEKSHEITDKTIDIFMNQYLCFFNKKMTQKGIDSPFWNTIKKINKELTKSKLDTYIIWNNIYKIGNKSKDKNRPNENIRKFENARFKKVIDEEIDILKPDLIILLTGPDYEKRVIKILPILEEKQIHEKIETNELAYFSLESGILAYRTYHPNHLNFKKKNRYINYILDEIKKYFHENTPDGAVL